MAERYQIWLHPHGLTQVEPAADSVRLTEVDTIRAAEIISKEMDLPDGVILYDSCSTEPINMPATKLCKLPDGRCIRGQVLIGELIGQNELGEGIYETAFDADSTEWIKLWAGGRCTVCGRGDKPVRWQAFPLSNGRCCERCHAVLNTLRQYMEIDKWDQP